MANYVRAYQTYEGWRNQNSKNWKGEIFTDAVELAKKIRGLRKNHVVFRIDVVMDAAKKEAALLTWDQEMIDSWIENLERTIKEENENNESCQKRIDELKAI